MLAIFIIVGVWLGVGIFNYFHFTFKLDLKDKSYLNENSHNIKLFMIFIIIGPIIWISEFIHYLLEKVGFNG